MAETRKSGPNLDALFNPKGAPGRPLVDVVTGYVTEHADGKLFQADSLEEALEAVGTTGVRIHVVVGSMQSERLPVCGQCGRLHINPRLLDVEWGRCLQCGAL